MPSVNKTILIGHITRDIELKFTPKGMAVATIGLAVNRTWYDKDSKEKREEVTFVDIDCFAKQAETIGQYCKKGDPLYVEGRLRLQSWDDKQTGQKRSKLGVVMESFQFLGGGKNADSDNASSAKPSAQKPKPPADDDEDFPPF